MKTIHKFIVGLVISVFASFIIYMAGSLIAVFTDRSHYKFEIVNKTPYHLDSIRINTAWDRNFSLAPNETSEEFSYDQKANLASFFAESMLCVYVLQYSTEGTTHKNNFGSAIGFTTLSEDKLNRIVITLEPDPTDSLNHFSSWIEEGNYDGLAAEAKNNAFARLRRGNN